MTTLIQIEYLYVLVLIVMGLGIFIAIHLMDDRTYNPEGKVFKTGRKKGVPVYSTEDPGTGNALFQLGHKEDDNDPIVEMDYGGMQIEPGFLSADATPTRYPGGLNIYHNSSTKSVPLPTKAALAYKTFKKHRHNGKAMYKQLDFLADNELTALLNAPRNQLDHDAGIFIAQYSPLDDTKEPMTRELLVELIKDMQDYLATLPVEGGWFCYHEMFKALPFSHSAQDTERIKSICEQKGWLKYMKNMDLMNKAMIVVMIMVGGGVAVYLGSLAAG